MKRKLFIVGLVIISLLSIGVRFYHINWPIADWHSWRQSDTAAVARNFLKFGIDPLHPRYDDLSNIQSGKDNPMGWRMVEFPLYQLIGVESFKLIPHVTIEEVLRGLSIVATGASVLLFGFLLSEIVNPFAGILGAFIYAVLPFSIYYGRAILPDPLATFCALVSLTVLWKRGNSNWSWAWVIVAGIFGAISLLVRPMEIFILFPAAYLVFRNTTFLKGVAYGLIYCVIIAVPLLWWRHWILQFPEGIPVSDWLYNNNGVRFKGAWFYWLFSQRLADLILGYWGLIPFGIGLVTKMKKGEAWFSLLWLAGALAYLIIFAGGNVQHDYYQALIIPVIVWFTAKGFYTFMRGVEGFNKFGSYALAIVCFLFLWAFSWYTIRTYFWINRPEIVEAGKAADALIPKNAKVIAPYNGDTTFLYQINRQGWPEGFDIAKKIAMGAGYYVTVSPTNNDLETRDLANMYTVLVRNDKYAIIDLTRKK